MEKIAEFQLPQTSALENDLTAFAKKFTYSAILLSNHYPDKYGKYEFLAAYGGYRILQSDQNSFEKLREFHDSRRSWLFGHLSYELKNEIEALQSKNEAQHAFSHLSFFEPAYLLLQEKGSKLIKAFVNEEVDAIPLMHFVEDLKSRKTVKKADYQFPKMQAGITKESYFEAFQTLQKEIQYGNIYEINYCQEFHKVTSNFSPYHAFNSLMKQSPMPFAAFYKNNSAYAISASPERFLQKSGNCLISQPIKGTAKRGANDAEDELLKKQLRNDLKEQTENVMIVDLVRNDLARTAAKGTVKVEELFGVYSFPQVHQLISTVSSQLSSKQHWTSAIKKAFPMGSMTGAPKISAMQIIDRIEKQKRNLYSGAIGYITPFEDFDFNVVIRSLLYNAETAYLSLTVGGAITAAATAKQEYQECLLKAKAIFDAEK